MTLLYRLFYIVIAIGIVMGMLLPVVLVFRFLLRNRERRYMMWMWRFIFLRSLFPFFMMSIFMPIPDLVRRFYLLIESFGLDMKETNGLMFRWRDFMTAKLTVTDGFRMCSILWLVGLAFFLLFNIFNKHRLKMIFQAATEIGEGVYEVRSIHIPVQMGVFRKKYYLPPKFHISELKWLLAHMENRGAEQMKRWFLVLLLSFHWFNPALWLYYYLWSRDNEIHIDEKNVYRGKLMKRREYAQSILNFRRRTYTHKNAAGYLEEDRVTENFCPLVVYERDTDHRARRMMYQKWDTSGKRHFARFCLMLLVFGLFFLGPLEQGLAKSWGSGKADVSEEKADTIITKKRQEIAGARTTSPDGLDRILKLEMKKGGTEGEDGYDGSFRLTMYDALDNKLAYMDMDEIFSHSIKASYHFSKDMALFTGDYNADGTNELVLGQKKVMLQKEFDELFTGKNDKKVEDYDVFSYSIINLDSNQMEVLNQDILSVVKKPDRTALAQTESILLGKVEGLDKIFYTDYADGKKYYEWDSSVGSYADHNLTDEEIEKRKQAPASATPAPSGMAEGDVNEHTLTADDGETAVLVTTKTDNTGSGAIQSVILSPRNAERKYENIKGYFCDLQWVPVIGSDEGNRYAFLIYNGAASRTFVIYDTKQKNIYYQQEDGTENLAKIFKQFNENEITFTEGGAVVYNLSEKTDDTLKIDFVATADHSVTVKGSYEYNVVGKTNANLSFSKSTDTETETKSEPTPETE